MSIELTQAKVAVGDEGAHAARLGEGQRRAVVTLGVLGIELIGMACDITLQVQRVGGKARLTRGGFDRAQGQAPRVLETTEQEAGATERVVARAQPTEEAPRSVTLEELLAFLDPLRRF